MQEFWKIYQLEQILLNVFTYLVVISVNKTHEEEYYTLKILIFFSGPWTIKRLRIIVRRLFIYKNPKQSLWA
jgi:hypothetical protein